MRESESDLALSTSRQGSACVRHAKNLQREAVYISSDRAIYCACAWAGAWRSRLWCSRSLPLQAVILAMIVMLTAPASGTPDARAEADNRNSETTIIRRAAPNEPEAATDRQIQEPMDWAAQTWLGLMTIVALFSFFIGRTSAPRFPERAAVRTAVEKVFEGRRMNADVHSFPEAVRVLHRAETEVLETLKKLKLVG